MRMLHFVFTNFKFKKANINDFFLRVIFDDHLRSDKWKRLKWQNYLRLNFSKYKLIVKFLVESVEQGIFGTQHTPHNARLLLSTEWP